MFLTILDTSETTLNTYNYNGTVYDFDFTKISFLAGTTDIQKISNTLFSRFKKIELQDYEDYHLAQIFIKGLKQYSIEEEVIPDFLKMTKNNPREINNLARDIRNYLYAAGKTELTMKAWEEIKNGLSLKPMGLEAIEIRILEALKKCPNSSLTKLGAILGIDPPTLRQKYELALLRLNLMQIKPAAGRSLTVFGHKYLDELKKKY